MISVIDAEFQHYSPTGATVNTYTMLGKSTDAKPTTEDVGNGSAFVEMDTSNVYFYDEAATAWLKWGGTAATTASTLSAPVLGMMRPSAFSSPLEANPEFNTEPPEFDDTQEEPEGGDPSDEE